MRPEDTIIVGAGPAGITAAIQLQRARVPFIILEQDRVGGLLWNANLVENYPGFPKGISGPGLASLFEKQMRQTGVQVTFDRVIQIDLGGDNFTVTTEITSYKPRYLIVATGTKPRPIPIAIPGEINDRILREVYPLLGKREQHIVIIGAGDAAFDYALNLAKHNMIHILHHGYQTSCLPLLWKRASANRQILYQDQTAINEVCSGSKGTNLLLRGKQKKAHFEIECDYVIYAIGREPQVGMLTPLMLAAQSDLAQTGRLHVVGDVANGYLRQTAIAAGDGLRAAMQIYADILR